MMPAFHLRISFARPRRIGGLIGLLLLIGLAGLMWTTIAQDLSREVTMAALGGLLIAMLGKEALPMLKPGLSATDGLLVSSNGLAVTRRGRTVEWQWDEISDLRVRGRLHPASLFLGKFISFRVPRDERRRAPGIGRSLWLGRGVLAIGDDYLTRPGDLLRQMEHYRDNAAGSTRCATSATPEAAWSFRKDRKKPKLVHILLAVGAPVAGLVAAMAIIGRLPGSISELIDNAGVVGGLVSAAAMLPFVVLMQFRFEAKQDNMLMMSAGGLHTRSKIEKRFWLWSDIIDMQFKQSASRGKDGGAEPIVSFQATHDGSKPGRQAKEGEALVPVSCSIEDTYERPIEEIARHARSWWEWSGETFGHVVVDAVHGQRITGPARDAGSIEYRRQTGTMNARSSLIDHVMPFVLLSPMLAYSVASIWMFKANIRLDLLPWWLDIGGMTVLMLGSFIALIAFIQPGLNRLELTEEGLLHVRYGLKRRWAWREIGVVELRRLRTKWSARQRPVVTVAAPGPGFGSALLRWAFNIDNPRLAVIEDIYDAPLDEIRDRLEQYRRRSGHGSVGAPARRLAG